MPIRPFRCYRKPDARPYTQYKYIRGVPGSKIVTYEMGARIEKFPVKATMYSAESGQIRHNSLEASRVMANRYLMKETGKNGYHLKILTFPHHILRENAMATGAGADRYQTGMRGSFGRPVGYAARVKEDQALMTVWVYANKEGIAREALRRAKMKLPIPCYSTIEYLKIDESRLEAIANLERLDEEREARRAAEVAAAEEAAGEVEEEGIEAPPAKTEKVEA
ncbi:MAG: 50S ribosomal protein L16 [Theionarchaea archaeon]|nr:50S ribosomal protein L16 [Theionarchaea archaeon]